MFLILVLVVVGSLLGKWLGIKQYRGELWFWIGNQGWEYLDLVRSWQILLAAGLLLWFVLLVKTTGKVQPATGLRPIAYLFPALFLGSATHFSVVDTWRFWIVHLWVEEFLEFFVTVMVAVIFVLLGLVSTLNARRIIMLEAILFSAGV